MKSPLLATLAGRFGAKSASAAGVTGRFYLFCPHFTPPLFRAPKVYLSVTRGWFRRCGRCATIQVFPQEIVEPPQAGLKKERISVMKNAKISRRSFLKAAGVTTAVAAVSLGAPAASACYPGSFKDITILYTNDVHTYIDKKSPEQTYAAIAA